MDINMIESAIDYLRDLEGVSSWRNDSTTSNNRYMASLSETIKALEQFKAEQKQLSNQ